MPGAEGLSYRDAGVDIDAADRAKDRIVELVKRTLGPNVVSRPGAFGGQYRVPTGVDNAVLVASADGVGTKLKVAMMAGRHDTVGQDLVNHCVDDILVEGARPLFFLDYIGLGKLEQGIVESLVAGMATACAENGCALLGGETAEMPDFYDPGEYDLAGFIVGIVDEQRRPGAHRVQEGDALLALPSSGFHTNGYSLLRKLLFERLGLSVTDRFPGSDDSVADVLLRVHRSYLGLLSPLLADDSLHALAHITGGGIPGNLSRVLPEGLAAEVHTAARPLPREFAAVMEAGRIEAAEMYRTFNMGVGMILVVAADAAGRITRELQSAGGDAWTIGRIVSGSDGVRLIDQD